MAKGNRFTAAAGAVRDDIVHKLLEEGVYGRQVTPETPMASAHDHHASFAELLGWHRPSGRDGPDHEPEHGMDH